ncbi:MAG: hypothetical protein MUC64_08045, partial [Rubritepida sp.]|nr:hypothetical protein [Rubritepida sp.]
RLIEAGPEWHRFAGGADMVVHPAQTLWAAKVNIPVVRSMMDDQIHIAGKPAAETVISVRLRFGALDHPQKTELLELQGQDLEIRLARG